MCVWDVLQNNARFVAGIGLLAIAASASLAADVEPYQARVSVTRADVLSGPGENFYPTTTLAQGETVEVYREQSGGWLAIRPPQDSFSWVFGRHLAIRDDGLAEVSKSQAASRIGSRLGKQRNAVQVQLRKGEVVEIVGEEQAGDETWYKISPPAGEFRWIHASSVERLAPLAKADRDAEPAVVAASATEAIAVDAQATTLPAVEKTQSQDDWRASLQTERSAAQSIVPPPLAPAAAAPQGEQAQPLAPPTADTAASQPAPTVPVAPVQGDLSRRLTDIELRISRMVSVPPDRWNTERLERDAEQLLAEAQTAEQRQEIKDILAKLDQFDAIARRHQPPAASAMMPGPVDATIPPTAGFPTVNQAATASPLDAPAAATDSGRYDAVGILRPVVSKRAGAPQFALVDDRGQVISFVTPTPDLNLQPYLGHRIGVTGARGFIPEFQRAHVTAGRVAPLSERLVR